MWTRTFLQATVWFSAITRICTTGVVRVCYPTLRSRTLLAIRRIEVGYSREIGIRMSKLQESIDVSCQRSEVNGVSCASRNRALRDFSSRSLISSHRASRSESLFWISSEADTA